MTTLPSKSTIDITDCQMEIFGVSHLYLLGYITPLSFLRVEKPYNGSRQQKPVSKSRPRAKRLRDKVED